MRQDVMIDFETLGVGPLACPTRMGAVIFDLDTGEHGAKSPTAGNKLNLYLNVAQCLEAGLKVTNETLIFWSKLQFHSVFPDYGQDMLPISSLLTAFENFCVGGSGCGYSDIKLWARGIDFDLTILQNLYRIVGRTNPFKYNCGRDIRTVFDVAGEEPKVLPSSGYVKHNPVDDCILQIQQLQECYKQLMHVEGYDD